jgi:hypothetical protein
MKPSHDSPNANPADEGHSAADPQSNLPSSPVRPKPMSSEAVESFEAEPYWVPYGVVMNDWPASLRAEVAALINPNYRELVLLARPGLAQSTGITIVHLMWLEILDHIELNQKPANDPATDQLNILGRETRAAAIERHLRLVHAKFKASDFLLRLQEFKARYRSQKKRPSDNHYPNLSAMARRPRQIGKNDLC